MRTDDERESQVQISGADVVLLAVLRKDREKRDACVESGLGCNVACSVRGARAVDGLTADVRRELSDLVTQAVAKDGFLYWRPTLHLVSVFYEGGRGPNDTVFLARMRRDFDETVIRWTDKLNRWAAGRTSRHNASTYGGNRHRRHPAGKQAFRPHAEPYRNARRIDPR